VYYIIDDNNVGFIQLGELLSLMRRRNFWSVGKVSEAPRRMSQRVLRAGE
jgi:hypothetical protein